MRNALRSHGFWQALVVLCLPFIALFAGADPWGVVLVAMGSCIVVLMGIFYQFTVRKSVKRTLEMYREITGRPLRCRGMGLRYYLLCMRRALKETARLLEGARKFQDQITEGIFRLKHGVILLGSDGTVVRMNETGARLTGFSQGQRLWEGPPLSAALLDAVKESRKTRSPLSVEFQAILPERRWIRADVVPFPGGKTLLVMDDITPVKNTEAVKSRLVSSVSHELRTPLTAIQGYLEMALEPGADEDTRQRALETARKNALRLSEFLDDLLELSRMESAAPRRENLRLGDILDEARTLFLPRAREKGLDMTLSAAQPGKEVSVDPGMLQTALFNLLDNAVKFTERGKVEVEARVEGKFLLLSVSDTGPGIPPGDLPMIFERFYKGRSSRGAGLGLALAKWAAAAHGGDIQVQSKHGRGSVFTLRIPL